MQPLCSICNEPLTLPVALPTYAERRCASCVQEEQGQIDMLAVLFDQIHKALVTS